MAGQIVSFPSNDSAPPVDRGAPVQLGVVAELLRGLNREQRRAVRQTGGTETLEEILLTTSERYYMARGLGTGEDHFLLLILDRHQGNLARAQLDLVSIERALEATRLGTV